jgi:DNA-binding beta-propeller fold protein YncE
VTAAGRRRAPGAALVLLALAALLGWPSPATAGAPAGSFRLRGGATCSTARAPAPRLNGLAGSATSVPGNPFGVVSAAGGRVAVVSTGDGLAVLSTAGPRPRVVGHVAVGGDPAGEALTPDGRDLVVASGSGAVVLDAASLVAGRAPEVASLTGGGQHPVEVVVSADDRYAFVSMEASDDVAVFDLASVLGPGAGGRGRPGGRRGAVSPIGTVPLGRAPAGLALSPDGRWLYATSEGGAGAGSPDGTLSVIDVALAESDPGRGAVAATVPAGCSPVRVAVSPDGATVWVTARGDDALLGFSAAGLIDDPARALVARVPVGRAPVGLAVVDQGRRVVVADSDRFGPHLPRSDLAVVDASAALAERPSLLGYVPSGRFPREVASVGRAVLITEFDSEAVQAVPVDRLP